VVIPTFGTIAKKRRDYRLFFTHNKINNLAFFSWIMGIINIDSSDRLGHNKRHVPFMEVTMPLTDLKIKSPKPKEKP
jgi:hypothetical protein